MTAEALASDLNDHKGALETLVSDLKQCWIEKEEPTLVTSPNTKLRS